MGILLSKPSEGKKSNLKDNYERVLSELDSQIQHSEILLSETRISERRMSIYVFSYSFLAILMALLFVFFYPRGEERRVVLDLFLLFGIPLGSYCVRQSTSWWYRRRISTLEAELQTHRAKQRLKVEELKERTAYYETRGLIERFDPDLRKSHQQESVPCDIYI